MARKLTPEQEMVIMDLVRERLGDEAAEALQLDLHPPEIPTIDVDTDGPPSSAFLPGQVTFATDQSNIVNDDFWLQGGGGGFTLVPK